MTAVLACTSLQWGMHALVVVKGLLIFAQGRVTECVLLLNTSFWYATLHQNSSQIL